MGYHVNDVQMMQTIESQLMSSHGSHTKRSQKRVAQNGHAKQVMSHPRIDMTNDAFGCSRTTQVHMEDLRLVNLTEIHPNQRGERFKAPC